MPKEIIISTEGKEYWIFDSSPKAYTADEIKKIFGFPPTKDWEFQMKCLGIEKIPEEYTNKRIKCICKNGAWYVEVI